LPQDEANKPGEPVTSSGENRGWSLSNLILSILSVLLAIIAVILYIVKRRRERDGTGDKRGRLLPILATLLFALASLIILFLTQDIGSQMRAADWWTIAHTLLFAGAIAGYIQAFKHKVRHL